MRTLGLLLLAIVVNVRCHYNLEPQSEEKSDIEFRDKYIFSRYLETERQTCNVSQDTVVILQTHYPEMLQSAVMGATKLLALVQGLMEGSPVKGCVESLSGFLAEVISEESAYFKECGDAAIRNIKQRMSVLTTDVANYNKNKARALKALDNCKKKFTSKKYESNKRLCIRNAHETFMRKGKRLAISHFQSPCMGSFEGSVVRGCINDSSGNLFAGTSVFLHNLRTCTSLMVLSQEDIKEIASLEKQLIFQQTIYAQIRAAQTQYTELHKKIEKELEVYNKLDQNFMRRYSSSSRTAEDLRVSITKVMASYYKTIDQRLADNTALGNSNCGRTAKATIDELKKKEIEKQVECQDKSIKKALDHVQEVADQLSDITKDLPQFGNVAILNCLKKDWIFEKNIIQDCYQLQYRKFNIQWERSLAKIEDTVEGLNSGQTSSKNPPINIFPCGEQGLQNLKLKADEAMFEYRRCAYQSADTPHDVTHDVTVITLTTTAGYLEITSPGMVDNSSSITKEYE